MKGPRQLRKAINRARSTSGKRNGVIGAWFFDFGARGPHTDKRAKARKPNKRKLMNEAAP